MANPYAQGLGGVGGSSYPQAGARSASPRRSLYDANSRRSVYGPYGLNDSPYRTMDYRYGRDDQGPGPQTADYRYGRDDKSGEMMPMVGQSMPYYAPPQRPVSFGGDGLRGSAERILGNLSRLPGQAYNAFSDVAQFPSRVMSEGLGNMSGISGRNAAPRPRQAAPSNPYRAIDNLGQQAYGAAKGAGNAFNSLNTYLGSVAPQLGRPSLSYDEYKAYSPDVTPSEEPSQAQQNYDAKWSAPSIAEQPPYENAASQLPSESNLPSALPSQMRSGVAEASGASAPQATTTSQAPAQSQLQQRLESDPDFRSQWMVNQIRNNTPFAQQYHADRMKDPDYAARVRAAEEAVRIPDAPQYQPITNITGADRKPLTNPGPASAVGARYEGGPTQQQMADYGVTPYSVALGQNRTYDDVAPGTTGATRDLSRAAVANAYDPQSWYTMGTTPAEQQADAAKRVANVGANYQSTIRQDPYSPLAGPGAAAGYNAMAAQDKARQQASDAAYQANRQKNLEAKAKSDAAMRAQGLDPDKERRESATLNAQYYNYIRASRAGGTKPVSYTDFAAIMKGGNAPQSVATQQPKSLQAPVSPTVLAQYALPAPQVAAIPDEGSQPTPAQQAAPMAPQMPTQQSTVPPAPQSYYDSNIPSLLALDSNPSQWNQTGARINDAIFPPLSQETVASEGKQAAPMAPQQPAAPVPAATAPTASAQNPASDPNYPFNNTEPMPTPASRNLPTRDELENMLQAQRNSVNQARQAVKDDRERRRLVGGPSLPMAAYMMNRYGIPMTLGMPREEAERQRYIENLGMSGLLPASYRANVIAQQQANLNNNTADVNQELIRANALRDTALTRGLADVQSAQIQADMLNTRMNAEEAAQKNELSRREQEIQSEAYRQHMNAAMADTTIPPAVRDQAEYQVISQIRNSSPVPLIPQLEARFRVLDNRFGNSQPNNAQTVYGTPVSPPVQGDAAAPSGGASSTPAVPTIKDPRQRSQTLVSVLANNVDTTSGDSYENFANLSNRLAAAGVGDITQQELFSQIQNTPLGQALSDKNKASAFLDSYLDQESQAIEDNLQQNYYHSSESLPGAKYLHPEAPEGKKYDPNYHYSNLQWRVNEAVQKFEQANAPKLNLLKKVLGNEYVNNAMKAKYKDWFYAPKPTNWQPIRQ